MFNIESKLEVIEEPSVGIGITTVGGGYIDLKPAIYYKVISSCGKLTYTAEYPSHRYNKLTAEQANEESLIGILESVVKNNLTQLV